MKKADILLQFPVCDIISYDYLLPGQISQEDDRILSGYSPTIPADGFSVFLFTL